MQYLYLIQCQDMFKIGIAGDVQQRLASLQTGNPFPLRVIVSYGFDNAEVVEKALHQKYKEFRGIGEWFSMPMKQAAQFEEFCQVCQMLGGVEQGEALPATPSDVEEAEEMQEAILDDGEYIQIQGSDRTYPAVVIRRKDRGRGATVRTISKFGKYADEYDQFQEEIQRYLATHQTERT